MKIWFKNNPGKILINFLMLWVFIFILSAAIYHFTHGGPFSGISEFVLSFILLVIWFLIIFSTMYTRSVKITKIIFIIGVILLILIIGFLFSLGIYHFSSKGLRSGLVETSMSVFLIVYGIFNFRFYKNRKIQDRIHISTKKG